MRAFLQGFVYAANGIWVAVKEERNLRFHLCAAAYVYLFSLFYPFGKIEYALLTLIVGAVIGMELLNSSIERAVGPPDPAKLKQRHAHAKDMAAGAVLALAITAVLCGVFLFWEPAVFYTIFLFFTSHLWLLALLLASFGVSYWFIARFGSSAAPAKKSGKNK